MNDDETDNKEKVTTKAWRVRLTLAHNQNAIFNFYPIFINSEQTKRGDTNWLWINSTKKSGEKS